MNNAKSVALTVARTLLRLALPLTLLTFANHAAADRPEYQLKAAFIYNFTKFVQWPDAYYAARPDKAIDVCVSADDDTLQTIDDVLKGYKVRGEPIRVRPMPEPAQSSACAIMFFADNEQDDDKVAMPVAGVLTIGEGDGFIDAGGMIRFYTENNKLRFEINPAAANDAGVKISSKLLRLARIVSPEPAGGE